MKTLSQLALNSLLWEVSATPKPGLVDRNNCGSHKDMDIFTFVNSAYSLLPHFESFALAGERHADLSSLFADLRILGAIAEEDMLQATKGVNTHRGAIFSLGLLVGAAEFLRSQGSPLCAESVCTAVANMCHGLCQRELAGGLASARGLKMYTLHGALGPRGEAQSGFSSVLRFGLPIYRQYLPHGQNTALARTLISLMANVFDTNVLNRSDHATAVWVMNSSQDLINAPIEDVLRFDQLCIAKNISPGGCADLLAVTYFLHNISLIP